MTPRVVMLIERYFPLVGGSEAQCRLLATTLRRSGVEVEILTRRIKPDTSKQERLDGLLVHRLPPAGIGRVWKEAIFAIGAAVWLIRHHRHYDIVHAHSGSSLTGLIVIPLLRLLNKGVVVKIATAGDIDKTMIETTAGVSTPPLLHRLLNHAINQALRRVDALVCISREIRQEAEHHGFRPSQLYSIPNAVDTERFAPLPATLKTDLRRSLGLPTDRLLVLFSGRLIHRKGIDTLIAAWGRLADHHGRASLLLLGAGATSLDSAEAALRSAVNRSAFASSVSFLDEQPDPLPYLQAADVFVFPSRREGLSNALLEALSAGLPTVASAIGGNLDVVSDGSNGLLFPAGDEERLTEQLRRLLTDADLRGTLSRAARQSVRERFDLNRICPLFLRLYEHLLHV